MKPVIHLRNESGNRSIRTLPFKQILLAFLENQFAPLPCHLDFHLLTAQKMADMNERHLGHNGPTDVITFDYNEASQVIQLLGEVFICPQVAQEQAAAYGTGFHEELVRYAVHGILHLAGYDDLEAADRKRMKKRENTIMKWLCLNMDLRLIVIED